MQDDYMRAYQKEFDDNVLALLKQWSPTGALTKYTGPLASITSLLEPPSRPTRRTARRAHQRKMKRGR